MGRGPPATPPPGGHFAVKTPLAMRARMAIVPEQNRLRALESLNLSAPVIALCSGEEVHPHPSFWYRCQAPHSIYHGGTGPDLGLILPFWECTTTVTAALMGDAGHAGPTFIEFSLEYPDEYIAFAVSEQGLLAYLFWYLIEDQDWHDKQKCTRVLTEAATAVGFRHLQKMLEFQQMHGDKSNYSELLAQYTRNIG